MHYQNQVSFPRKSFHLYFDSLTIKSSLETKLRVQLVYHPFSETSIFWQYCCDSRSFSSSSWYLTLLRASFISNWGIYFIRKLCKLKKIWSCVTRVNWIRIVKVYLTHLVGFKWRWTNFKFSVAIVGWCFAKKFRIAVSSRY